VAEKGIRVNLKGPPSKTDLDMYVLARRSQEKVDDGERDYENFEET